jgi:hypothetical protein
MGPSAGHLYMHINMCMCVHIIQTCYIFFKTYEWDKALAMDDIWLWLLMPHGFLEKFFLMLGIDFMGQKTRKNLEV